jgi:lipoteichoic acid synthase
MEGDRPPAAASRAAVGLLPTAWGWLRLVGSPSSYLLLLGLVLTAAAKLAVLRDLGEAGGARWLLPVVASDVALHMGLAALFALGERRVPWILFATVPLSLLVLVLSALNAIYLGMTGEQLSWQGVSIGIERFDEVWGIVGEALAAVGPLRWAIGVALVTGLPLGAAWLLRAMTGSGHPTRHGGERARCAAALAVVGLLVALLVPSPGSVPLRRLERSAALATYLGLLADDDGDAYFAGHQPLELVDGAAIRRLAAGPRPSVVVVVLESTRWDVTSLGGGPAHTPALVALAARGTEVEAARAVLPHTTKSLWSILCGRLPLMQLALYEIAATAPAQCLPHVLAGAGYRTGFLQSALGAFEDRPRLVANLGFGHFAAWEDIGGEPLGYLASDDESLAAPLFAFVDQAPGPFFAVLLTSATHHPYRLPPAAEARAAAAGAPRGSDLERYHRLVEAEDALLAAVVAELGRRDLLERTIVVAVGDHGEGFGDKGVKQHDTNFFEEGLRVPWAMAGPGVPVQKVRGAASLLDVTPTLLAALGVELAEETRAALPGASLLAGAPPPGPRPFGCWFDGKCRGYVEGEVKVVAVPESGHVFAFDLDRDPAEGRARPLGERERAVLGRVERLIDRHRTAVWPFELAAMERFPPWRCPPRRPCRHPNSPPGGMFGRP